ncbi:hypothetical protein [Winogradskyella haliclonae]|uniref:Uncharacterized protein n=1 Tax=Winogradskyella haliclonae TaxID=2048558 RepID=A0ABQ2C2M2_9FLAO|nr:hypothetical protein [Winogradskyella haliclonae]GGI58318.1 hypothetical protein GCM10011444_26270 [Winogradskyella haliclonae]
MKYWRYIFGLLVVFSCNDKKGLDLPLEDYKNEIKALNSKDYYNYWEALNNFDQKVVVEAKNYKAYDSLSLVTLIKSALFYELKGDSIFKAPNSYNEFFFIHNLIPKSNLDFWPLLIKQKEVTGKLLMFPSYQLEGLTGSFYDYSVFGQDSIYDSLLSKIKPKSETKLSEALIDTYIETKRIQKLSIKENIGAWHRKRFKSEAYEAPKGHFELLKLSDDGYYIRFNKAGFRPVDIIDKNNKSLTFKPKHDPFGWYFVLNNDGNLSLYNEKNALLIAYTKV